MSTIIRNTIIILTSIFGIAIDEATMDPQTDLAYQISRLYHPSQVTIFVNKTEESSVPYQQTIVVTKIMQMNPSVIIDLVKFSTVDFNRTVIFQNLSRNPRQVSIHVILLQNRRSLSRLLKSAFRFFKFFVSLNRKVIRPKVLLLFFANGPADEDIVQLFEEVANFAWNREFLDFSIVQFDSKNNAEAHLFYYNPFLKSFFKTLYNARVELFVDKLKDVHRYPMYVILINQPPFLQFSFDNTGKLVIKGLYFNLLNIAAQKMNFESTYFHNSSVEPKTMMRYSLNRLSQGHADLLARAIAFIQSKAARMSLGLHYYEGFVAIVPIVTYTKFYIPINNLVYLIFIIPAIAICLIRLSVYLRILSLDMSIFDMIKLLYGAPTSQPHKLPDRIVFFSLVFISMQYSMMYYSRLLDGQILQQERSFASFREIADSQLDIFINRKYVDRYLPTEDPDARRIKEKVKTIGDLMNCVRKLSTRSVICIGSQLYAEHLVETYLNNAGQRIGKVAPVIFSQEMLYIYTRDAFPYAEKFQKIVQSIYESGIWPSRFIEQKMVFDNETVNRPDAKQKEGLMIYTMTMMLATGFLVALMAFVCEKL